MHLEVSRTTGVVFDLDDTLYKERDFQQSGFRAVLASIGRSDDADLLRRMGAWDRNGGAAIQDLCTFLSIDCDVASMLNVYRFHDPEISLVPGAAELLDNLSQAGTGLGLITDGRSRTQRAKLKSLGIAHRFDVIVISDEIGSEKPARENFDAVNAAMPDCSAFVFIADNPRKDFITPNSLGWTTIQVLDDGWNVHSQDVEIPPNYAAQLHVPSLADIQIVTC